MRSLASLLWLVLPTLAAPPALYYHVPGRSPGSWPAILGSVALQPQPAGAQAGVVVLRAGATGAASEWLARVNEGAFLILEGRSEVAEALGFRAGAARVRVQSLEDAHQPKLAVIWERGIELPVYEVPEKARVFARERWKGAPLTAGFRHGAGAVLWVAASPGQRGYERFPYLLHALADLGFEPPFRSRRLWAFFDSSYRLRADVEYLAARWRRSGIAALHVAAWHYWERDGQRDAWLAELIRACRRNAILVYAWLELPHVSERFWEEHPEWREKTAVLQDAHLDWRKLMNLAHPECERAVAAGVRELLSRFDWDGVNLAELYFESLEGAGNPSRFTPMNEEVRREFRAARGWDPLALFTPGAAPQPERLREFLEYRAGLARRLQAHWLEVVQAPGLDVALTHIDDRFDTNMRDALGADAAAVLPLLERHDFTFLVEDPATVWHLGPQRYPEIAKRYAPLTKRADRLAIDINVVERYQDVYPTKQQTGSELFQLVSMASGAFRRVALYFENSIAAVDAPLLSAAAANVSRIESAGTKLAVQSPYGVGVAWKGPALVDGAPWPARDDGTLWLPAGVHLLEKTDREPALRLLDFNGDLESAAARPGGLEFVYTSGARAAAVFDRRPARLEIDGQAATPDLIEGPSGRFVLRLPKGKHQVRVAAE